MMSHAAKGKVVRTRRQLRRCELARRLFIEKAKKRAMLQADFTTVIEDEQEIRVPVCRDTLRQAGSAWGQVADLGDSQIIWLPKHGSPPARIVGNGVHVVDPAHIDWDRLITPVADGAAGHFSYAHKRLFASDDFGTNYDPLSNDADWTALRDGAYIRANAGKCYNKAPGGSNRFTTYRFDPADMSGESADYSVEAALSRTTSTVAPCLCMRQTASDTYYYLAPSLTPQVVLSKRVGGVATQLGAANIASAVGTGRVEAVGTALKAYWGGVEEISASDGAISSAGYAGVFVYVAAAGGANEAYIDDFNVWVERPGRPAPVIGPLAGRAQISFALAR